MTTTPPKRCICGNYMGDNTPANGQMCMDCWCARLDRPSGQQQADTPPDRPGNPLVTFEISEHFIPRQFGQRLSDYARMMREYEDIDND